MTLRYPCPEGHHQETVAEEVDELNHDYLNPLIAMYVNREMTTA
jgi:hypothetical protein